MDNKRWYSRFGTIFWWFFAILPLIVCLIHFTGYHFASSYISTSSDLISYQNSVNGNFDYLFRIYCDKFSPYTLSFIRTMFIDLFNNVGFFGDTQALTLFASFFGWCTSVAFYHVVFDFSVWIFNWIHSLFDRWGCFK